MTNCQDSSRFDAWHDWKLHQLLPKEITESFGLFGFTNSFFTCANTVRIVIMGVKIDNGRFTPNHSSRGPLIQDFGQEDSLASKQSLHFWAQKRWDMIGMLKTHRLWIRWNTKNALCLSQSITIVKRNQPILSKYKWLAIVGAILPFSTASLMLENYNCCTAIAHDNVAEQIWNWSLNELSKQRKGFSSIAKEIGKSRVSLSVGPYFILANGFLFTLSTFHYIFERSYKKSWRKFGWPYGLIFRRLNSNLFSTLRAMRKEWEQNAKREQIWI